MLWAPAEENMKTVTRLRQLIMVWPLISTALGILTQAANAQQAGGSVIPPQFNTFLCANYNAVVAIIVTAALVVMVWRLLHGLIRRGSALIVDIVLDIGIALVVINLKSILAFFGLTSNC